MGSLWGKIVTVLVTVLLVLQIIHLIMLNKLESRRVAIHQPLYPAEEKEEVSLDLNVQERYRYPDLAADFTDEVISATEILQKRSILDTSGHYKIAKFIFTATKYSSFIANYQARKPFADLTLVTQCSLSHLKHLIELSRRWKGPISVAVFSTQDPSEIIQEIVSLRSCYPSVRQLVSFHLVYPLTSSSWNTIESPSLLPCSYFEDATFSSQKPHTAQVQNYALNVSYPNNLLRNEARKAALTSHVLVVDIDMLPSEHLRRSFLQFARENKLFGNRSDPPTVYVIPAFEMRQGQPVPANKKELLELIAVHAARPFYAEACGKCHSQTDYPAWQKEPWANKLHVSYEVPWKDPWEPFYIGRNDVPFYDERFQQYGFNRISQVCEVHIAGYKFAVLNDAFLIHQGFKRPTGFHPDKDAQLERNRLLYRQFKQDLKERYADSPRRCY